MAKKCGVCKEGDLIPSGCGCSSPKCPNSVEKWELCKSHSASVPPRAAIISSLPPEVPVTPMVAIIEEKKPRRKGPRQKATAGCFD